MIEWRFGLAPLTERDAQANNLAEVLDFKAKNRDPRLFEVPPGPFGGACPKTTIVSGSSSDHDAWLDLRDTARQFGWVV